MLYILKDFPESRTFQSSHFSYDIILWRWAWPYQRVPLTVTWHTLSIILLSGVSPGLRHSAGRRTWLGWSLWQHQSFLLPHRWNVDIAWRHWGCTVGAAVLKGIRENTDCMVLDSCIRSCPLWDTDVCNVTLGWNHFNPHKICRLIINACNQACIWIVVAITLELIAIGQIIHLWFVLFIHVRICYRQE